MVALCVHTDLSNVLMSLPPELAILGDPIVLDPPFHLHETMEESSTSMPYSTQSSISSTQVGGASTEQEVSSDSSAGQLNAEVPKKKKKKRKRCGVCENCRIPDCKTCRYCL
jgi:hypothetical protein